MSEESDPKNTGKPKPSAFSEFVRDFAAGDLDEEVTKKMSELIGKLRTEALSQGNDAIVKGALSFKLAFAAECSGGGRDVTIETSYTVDSKDPKRARAREMFFANKDGAMLREPPRQTRLFPVIEESAQ